MRLNDLIASVVVHYLARKLGEEPQGPLRFCLVGFGTELTSAMARAVLGDARLHGPVAVRIPRSLANGELPADVVSSQTAVHWRHVPLPLGARAYLLAIDAEEQQRSGRSVAELARIDARMLRRLHGEWLVASGLASRLAPTGEVHRFAMILELVENAALAPNLEMFAAFVAEMAEGIVQGRAASIDQAAELALPLLRLPRGVGVFGVLQGKKRVGAAQEREARKLTDTGRLHLERRDDKGKPLDTAAMSKVLDELERAGELGPEELRVAREFLAAPATAAGEWSEPQQAFANLEWPKIATMFAKTVRKASKQLGKQTIDFFRDEYPDVLESDDVAMLERLRNTNKALPEAVAFYHAHRNELGASRTIREYKNLDADWARYVFSAPHECHDLLEGIVHSLGRLIGADAERPENPVFLVELQGARQRSFWTDHRNLMACRYLQQRYHGIAHALGPAFEFRLGRMQEVPFQDLEDGSTARGREALEFTFDISLVDRSQLGDGRLRRGATTVQLIWCVPQQALALSLYEDLRDLTRGDTVRLATARITRELVNAKGEIQSIDLTQAGSVRDALNGNDGRLVNVHDGVTANLYPRAIEALEGLLDQRILGPQQAHAIREALERFYQLYSQALLDWVDPDGPGIGSEAFIAQAQAWGELLAQLRQGALQERAIASLWLLVLSIGVAHVESGGEAAIITPWQPLKLAELAVKARQLGCIAQRVLVANEDDLRGADLFFQQKRHNLSEPWYPEVCLAHDGTTLLACTAQWVDYTLMERPVRTDHPRSTVRDGLDADVTDSSRRFAEVASQYLEIHPHERTNFACMLYNDDSRALPGLIASELAVLAQADAEMRCHFILSHDDAQALRRSYERQTAAIGDGTRLMVPGEGSTSFAGRLRIGFVDATAHARQQGRPNTDIVFLHDPLARSASVDWIRLDSADIQPELRDHEPPQWSRRRPARAGDRRSAVGLACPAQPEACQRYLDALCLVTHHAKADAESHYMPLRIVDLERGQAFETLAHAHKLADWVAVHDAMADRQVYERMGIAIVRYVQERGSHRRLIVSTTQHPRMLLAELAERVEALAPGLGPERCRHMASLFKAESLHLSGQVVLRAARHAHSAGELMGLVLSMARVRQLLGNPPRTQIGWFFLDDYASWFGQREGQIADILALRPVMEGGQPVLDLVIVESKFAGRDAWQGSAKKSASQLTETLGRIARALDPERQRLDGDVWLARLADLMLESLPGHEDLDGSGWYLERWSKALRMGQLAIRMLGLSHIFVHEEGGGEKRTWQPVGRRGEPAVQEVFDVSGIRSLMRAMHDNAYTTPTPELDDRIREEALIWHVNGRSVRPDVERPVHPDASPDTMATQGQTELAVRHMSTPDLGPVVQAGPDVVEQAGIGEQRESAPHAPGYTAPVQQWLRAQPDDVQQTGLDAWIGDVETRLRLALRSYQMTSELLGSRLTPNAALLRFRGSDNLTVPKVEKRQQELLTSHGLEVINVLAGVGEVVISVRRPRRAVLPLATLWRERQLMATAPEVNTSLLIGAREDNGQLLYLNYTQEFADQPAHAPHTLIAGETGSGKGVLVQCLLLDICATNSPRRARVRMIDPKAGVDFPWLRQMPHLDGEICVRQEEAVATLQELVQEMERRYELLAAHGKANIETCNRSLPEAQRLPRIWLFHDEMADWMLVADYRDRVEEAISRLAGKARAAGIHLVLITQRPDKDAVPPMIRDNVANRLVLKVASEGGSKIALGESGAEKLLGRGHIATRLASGNVLAQVPFASEEAIEELAHAIAQGWRERPEG